MTAHRMLFDLRPVQKVVATLAITTEPSLREQEEAIGRKADELLGSAPRDDVRPLSEADLRELEQLVKLSPVEVLELTVQSCRDILEFFDLVKAYFGPLRAMRDFNSDEQALGNELRKLLDEMRERLSGRRGNAVEKGS